MPSQYPSSPDPPVLHLRPGDIIDNWTVIRLISSGGIGDIYEVEDNVLKSRSALKYLRAEHASIDELFIRTLREARLGAQLQHPNLNRVFAAGMHNGRPYFVMDLLSGMNLREWLAVRGSLSIEDALFVLMQVCSGVAALHARGVTHRDLKPENIFVTYDAVAKVLDLGGAKFERGTRTLITKRDEKIGTAAYMAPEQFAKKEIYLSDVYAIGLIAYELLGGIHAHVQYPGEWPTDEQLMYSHLHKTPVPLTDRLLDFPDSLWQIIAQCLSKAPEARPTALALLQALGREFDRYSRGIGSSISPGALFRDHPRPLPLDDALSLTDDPQLHPDRFSLLAEKDPTPAPVELKRPVSARGSVIGFDIPASFSLDPASRRVAHLRRWSFIGVGGLIGIAGALYLFRPPVHASTMQPRAPAAIAEGARTAHEPVLAPKPEASTAPLQHVPTGAPPSSFAPSGDALKPVETASEKGAATSDTPPAASSRGAPRQAHPNSKVARPALSSRLLTPTFSVPATPTDEAVHKVPDQDLYTP